MKQDNTTNRVDRGWARLQPELDKAFPPKKERKLLPWVLLAASMMVGILYITVTQTQNNSQTDLAKINPQSDLISPIDGENESKSGLESNEVNQEINKYNTTKGTQQANSEVTRIDNIQIKEQTNLTPTQQTLPTLANQNNFNSPGLNNHRLPIQNQATTVINNPVGAHALEESTSPSLRDNLLTESGESMNLPSSKINLATIKDESNLTIALLPLSTNEQSTTLLTVPHRSERPYTHPMSIIPLDNNTYRLSPIVINQFVYNPNSISTELMAGARFHNESWAVSLSLGGGYKFITSNETDQNVALEQDALPGINTIEFNPDIRNSLPREPEFSDRSKNLYALGQLSLIYKIANWRLTSNVGTQINHFRNIDPQNAPFGIGSQSIELEPRYVHFVGGQLAYAFNQNLDLELGYRRGLAINSQNNYFTFGLSILL